jgi:Raf kinase inhibitor-like YbhB/YbcL family protein
MSAKQITLVVITLFVLNAAHATPAGTFQLTSPDLPVGQPIPAPFIGHDFGCSGPGLSPALIWKNEPKGTKSFAITMFDSFRPPASGWWHWLVYNLPATTHSLPRDAGALDSKNLPVGANQGHPDGEAPQSRYYGPCPDVGDQPHHYIITVYALSVDHVDIPITATGAQIDYVISGKTLAKATLDRTYAR